MPVKPITGVSRAVQVQDCSDCVGHAIGGRSLTSNVEAQTRLGA